MQSINTSLKLALGKMDEKMCLAVPEQSKIISKKNKGQSLTFHMVIEQCYFEKDKYETLS